MEDRHKITSFTFYYPSRILGGAELLFMRMASALINSFEVEVFYVDFPDGFAKNNFGSDSKINFIEYHHHKRIKIPNDTLIISPLSSILEIGALITSTSKVLFWSIHPNGLEKYFALLYSKMYLPFTKKNKLSLGKIIDTLISTNAVVFMDKPNFDYQRKLFEFKHESINFLPIPLEGKTKMKIYGDSSEVSMAWLGRLSTDKISSLINILKCCDEYLLGSPTDHINFHIIGEGSEMESIIKYSVNSKLNITFCAELRGESLDSYLRANVDVLFAMGTSALEGASLNIATILVDYSYEPFSTNKFRWLFEAEGFSLGNIHLASGYFNNSFEEIVDYVKAKQVSIFADKCYQYFLNNHGMENVTKKFISAAKNTHLTLEELKESNLKKFVWLNSIRRFIYYLKFICKKS